MVKHVIVWKLKDEYSSEHKEEIKTSIKRELEGLFGKIPGLVEIKVNKDGLPSSNCDLMLDTTFDNVDSLKGYSVHPEHVKVADTYVRPYTAVRSCFDFEI